MSGGIDVSVVLLGDRKLEARLAKVPDNVRKAVFASVREWTLKLLARSQRKVSGEVLKVRTGRLRRGLNDQYQESKNEIVGSVGINRRTVPYARIHEMGGKTKPHVILPKTARVLVFQKNGQTIFTTRVNHPGSKMPMRSFLRSSLTEMRDQIRVGLAEAAAKGMRE